MMLKKIVAAFLFVLLTAFALSSCSGSETGTPEVPEKPVEIVRNTVQDRIHKGINVSMPFECDAGDTDYAWGYEEQIYKDIAEVGFDHIRIPFVPENYFVYQEDGTLTDTSSLLVNLDKAVNYALSNGLIVVLDCHVYKDLCSDFVNRFEGFYAIWEMLAEHYKDYPDELLFEIFNEPSTSIDVDDYNFMQNDVIEIIRKISPNRIIVVGCRPTNLPSGLADLNLPTEEEDPNIMIDVHNYAPKAFTHQPLFDYTTPVAFDKMAKSECEALFKKVGEYKETSNRIVWLGEFGCYQVSISHEDTSKYVEYMTGLCDTYGMPWCWWDFACGFGAYEIDTMSFNDYIIAPMKLTPKTAK